LEVGQLLAVYPRNLKSAKKNSPVAVAEAPLSAEKSLPSEEFQQKSPPPAPTENPDRFAGANPIPEAPPSIAPSMEKPSQPEAPRVAAPQPEPVPFDEPEVEAQAPATQGLNWNQILEQEWLAILIGGALIVLLLALRLRKKRLSKGRPNNSEPQESYSEETSSKYGKGR